MWRTTAVTFCSYSSTSRVTPSSAKRWPQAHWPEYRTGLLGLRAACWREEGGRVLTPLLCHEIKRKTRTNPKAKKKTVRRRPFAMTLLSGFHLGIAPENRQNLATSVAARDRVLRERRASGFVSFERAKHVR